MSEAFIHLSVLGEEAPEALVGDPDGLYVDGTFGRGGHSRRILEKLSPKGRLIAFDRDPQAVEVARSWTDPRFTIIHEPFSTMTESLAAIGVHQADGIFLDIGVSSPQIDDAARGFSFRNDAPADMRMDPRHGVPAFCKIDVEGYELEVLCGLSRPIPALSFEYLSVCLDRARACVARLAELGQYQFNWSVGESHRLRSDGWLDADRLLACLGDLGAAGGSGDIYARLRAGAADA